MYQRLAGIVVVVALALSIGRWAAQPAQGAKPPRGSVSHVSRAAAVTAERRAALSESYGKLPLAFEPSQGQTDKRVKFLSRGRGYSLFLTPTEAVLALRESGGQQNPSGALPVLSKESTSCRKGSHAEPAKTKPEGTVLRVRLAGANRNPKIEGLDPLPGKANYFIGNDPGKWHTNVPTYSRVKYHNVYSGIDLVYRGSNQRELEYDFIVAPGADPKAIQLNFKGAHRLAVNDRGDLVVRAAGGDVIERLPIVYQELDGERRAVS